MCSKTLNWPHDSISVLKFILTPSQVPHIRDAENEHLVDALPTHLSSHRPLLIWAPLSLSYSRSEAPAAHRPVAQHHLPACCGLLHSYGFAVQISACPRTGATFIRDEYQHQVYQGTFFTFPPSVIRRFHLFDILVQSACDAYC